MNHYFETARSHSCMCLGQKCWTISEDEFKPTRVNFFQLPFHQTSAQRWEGAESRQPPVQKFSWQSSRRSFVHSVRTSGRKSSPGWKDGLLLEKQPGETLDRMFNLSWRARIPLDLTNTHLGAIQWSMVQRILLNHQKWYKNVNDCVKLILSSMFILLRVHAGFEVVYYLL